MYSCEFGSRRSTKSLLKQTSSKKINCPFQIIIKSNKSSLLITDIVDHSDHFQGRYSKPPIESDVKKDIEKFKEVKAKNVHVAQYVSKKSNYNYSTKDIRNTLGSPTIKKRDRGRNN